MEAERESAQGGSTDGGHDRPLVWDTKRARVVGTSLDEHGALLANSQQSTTARQAHTGRCHCGSVRFTFTHAAHIVARDCNCSVCARRGYLHVTVPKDDVRFEPSADAYDASSSTYQFNTNVARHTFCKTCGVQSLYTPRSDPDCYSVNLRCIEPGTLPDYVPIVPLDGKKFTGSPPT